MADILTRLTTMARVVSDEGEEALLEDAAAEIERLRECHNKMGENVVTRDREIERLRDALREIRDLAGTSEDMSRIAAHTLGVRYD